MALKVKKKKLTKISFLSFYLRKLEEKEQEEEKRKNKIQAKSNRIETGNRKAGKKRKINEIKSWFFEKINWWNYSQGNKEENKAQTPNNIKKKNERTVILMDSTDIKNKRL